MSKSFPLPRAIFLLQGGVKVGHENGASMLFGEIQIAYFARGPTHKSVCLGPAQPQGGFESEAKASVVMICHFIDEKTEA